MKAEISTHPQEMYSCERLRSHWNERKNDFCFPDDEEFLIESAREEVIDLHIICRILKNCETEYDAAFCYGNFRFEHLNSAGYIFCACSYIDNTGQQHLIAEQNGYEYYADVIVHLPRIEPYLLYLQNHIQSVYRELKEIHQEIINDEQDNLIANIKKHDTCGANHE